MTFAMELTDLNYLIKVFLARYWVICCWIRDSFWIAVDCCLIPDRNLAEAMYYNRWSYLLYEGGVIIVESNKPEESIFVPMPELTVVRKSFLEGNSGVYVLAVHPEEKFELYQFLEQQMKLKKITDESNNRGI